MLEYSVTARRTAPATAVVLCARSPGAAVALDTDPAGRRDALNPAELLLTALGACMLKGIERVTPMLRFQLRGAAVHVHGVRQDSPPRMLRIDYELVIDTDEPDRRLELLHANVRKFGTVYNTIADAVELAGSIRRGDAAQGATASASSAVPTAADEYC
jgi:uncharacterized OsmC-like protein